MKIQKFIMRLIPLRLRWCLESKASSRLSWRNLFPFTLQRGNLKTKSSVILDLWLRKTQAGKSRDYRDVIVFKKIRFQIVFHSTLRRKAGVFKFLRFEERFRKAPFSWRISVDGSPNRTNKASWRRESSYAKEIPQEQIAPSSFPSDVKRHLLDDKSLASK